MAVIRVKKSKDYTVVNNSYLRDKNLSLKTIGLMTIMLSLPESWDYTIEGLSSLLKDGKTTVRTALQELERNKYLVRNRKRDELGKLTSTEYILYEKNTITPISENPMLENLTLEKPMLENRTQLNTNILSTKEINTNNIYNNNNNKEKNIFEYIEENFGRTLSPIEYEEINTWEDNDLTRYAIKQSVLGGIYNLKYISKILYEYEKNNIKTVQQAQVREEQHKKQRGERKNYQKPAYKTARDKLRELEEQARIDDEREALENAKA